MFLAHRNYMSGSASGDAVLGQLAAYAHNQQRQRYTDTFTADQVMALEAGRQLLGEINLVE
jgi:hypothetical protein